MIVCWLGGGPPHLDMFDMKPDAPEGIRGPHKPIASKAHGIQVSEKYVVSLRLEVHNKGGHASVPVPDNAIYHLAGALTRLHVRGVAHFA